MDQPVVRTGMWAGADRVIGAGAVILGLLAGAAQAARVAPPSSPPPGAHGAPQVVPDGGGSGGGVSPFVTSLSTDPNDPVVKAYASAQKVRMEQERELRKLRAKYFLGSKNTEMRQIGITRLREFTDPAIFPALLKVFEHDGKEIRGAVLDHLRDQGTDEADTTLAWAAVFDKDKWFREEAGRRLLGRMSMAKGAAGSGTSGAGTAGSGTEGQGDVSARVKSVIAYALRSKDDATVAAAAHLTGTLGLLEAIPALINAQVVGGSGGGGGGVQDDSSLAYILVGTQQAFVADLTPVVGDSAVAFDPTLGVVTDGVYIRVIDAVVITYRTEVHAALVDLSTRGWDGRSTASLGWDQQAWRDWYAKEYLPYRKQLAEAKTKETGSGE